MKLIKAFIHHVRTPDVIQALADAGFRNLTLEDVRGTLKPLPLEERDYSTDMAGLVISEVRLSLVCNDEEVDAATAIIRAKARVGSGISGYVYVSPVEQALPIGGPGDST
ncbi:MAG: transcriptional regulator [Gammaproteobacteria bacterium HGW-Gammaproteobacteria-4]|jgi:nitrogen regulatory protein P-II 1|nr:MAG: transcriptional regulator [Gammaproteobacteria bacterium HGW-Gammaproteobacteria-4]